MAGKPKAALREENLARWHLIEQFQARLKEVAGSAAMHVVVSLVGILIMSGMAWVISWYKRSADKDAKKGIGNADMAGGSL